MKKRTKKKTYKNFKYGETDEGKSVYKREETVPRSELRKVRKKLASRNK